MALTFYGVDFDVLRGGGNWSDNEVDISDSLLNEATSPFKLSFSGLNNSAIVSFSDSPLGSLDSALSTSFNVPCVTCSCDERLL